MLTSKSMPKKTKYLIHHSSVNYASCFDNYIMQIMGYGLTLHKLAYRLQGLLYIVKENHSYLIMTTTRFIKSKNNYG